MPANTGAGAQAPAAASPKEAAKPDVPVIQDSPTAEIVTADTLAAVEDAKVPAGSYVVAPGRTVSHPEGDYGPGQIVPLDENEAKRLRRLGFILTPDGGVEVQTSGPAVFVEDGIQVTAAKG